MDIDPELRQLLRRAGLEDRSSLNESLHGDIDSGLASSLSDLTAQIAKIVQRIHGVYDIMPELHDQQPESFKQCMPMPLDEWYVALLQASRDWKALPQRLP